MFFFFFSVKWCLFRSSMLFFCREELVLSLRCCYGKPLTKVERAKPLGGRRVRKDIVASMTSLDEFFLFSLSSFFRAVLLGGVHLLAFGSRTSSQIHCFFEIFFFPSSVFLSLFYVVLLSFPKFSFPCWILYLKNNLSFFFIFCNFQKTISWSTCKFPKTWNFEKIKIERYIYILYI